jgi:hypothetical protein
MVRAMPDDFKLYRPQKFNAVSRNRFYRDRRARWFAHCGGSVTDSLAVIVDQVVGLEWDIRRLERREIEKGRLSGHDRIALAAWRRHLREALRLLGPRIAETKPVTVGDLVRDIERTKASAAA